MIELLVAALCVGDFQCGKATDAYYRQNVGLQRTAADYKRDLKHNLGPEVIYTSTLATIFISGKARVRIAKNYYLKFNGEETMFVFTRSF